MAEQRVGTSLDAFDALIAGLADAGEVAGSEVTLLREQDGVPVTAEIPVQHARHDNRWSVPRPDSDTAVSSPVPVAAEQTASPSVQPLTRREARRLRELSELADRDAAIEAESARRTEELIRSRRVRPAAQTVPAVAAAPKRPRSARRSIAAAVGAFTLIPSLWFVMPATADSTYGAPTADANGHTAQQILSVADDVDSPTLETADYVATALASIVASEGGTDAADSAPLLISALQMGGNRQKIIETALSYIGTPYVLGGDSHQGIDCSGLTMEAYAAVGISLAHYVPTQDARGVRISQADARPGDFVVFDNEDHIGIYLGGNEVLAAPAPGRRVSIESVDLWRPTGIHFTRVLPAGQ